MLGGAGFLPSTVSNHRFFLVNTIKWMIFNGQVMLVYERVSFSMDVCQMCGGWRVLPNMLGLYIPIFHLTKNHPTKNTSQDGPMSPMPSERGFRITNDYVRALMGRSLGYELVLSEAR